MDSRESTELGSLKQIEGTDSISDIEAQSDTDTSGASEQDEYEKLYPTITVHESATVYQSNEPQDSTGMKLVLNALWSLFGISVATIVLTPITGGPAGFIALFGIAFGPISGLGLAIAYTVRHTRRHTYDSKVSDRSISHAEVRGNPMSGADIVEATPQSPSQPMRVGAASGITETPASSLSIPAVQVVAGENERRTAKAKQLFFFSIVWGCVLLLLSALGLVFGVGEVVYGGAVSISVLVLLRILMIVVGIGYFVAVLRNRWLIGSRKVIAAILFLAPFWYTVFIEWWLINILRL